MLDKFAVVIYEYINQENGKVTLLIARAIKIHLISKHAKRKIPSSKENSMQMPKSKAQKQLSQS